MPPSPSWPEPPRSNPLESGEPNSAMTYVAVSSLVHMGLDHRFTRRLDL